MHSSQVQCALSPLRSQPQFPCVPVGCALCLFWGAGLWLQPSWRMSTIQNLRKSLVRDWRPVCSLVGDAVLGAELHLSPPLCLLPLAGDGLVHQRLALLWYLLSPLFWEGRVVPKIRAFPKLILSLLLSRSLQLLSLALAPSDCPQGIRARSLL